MARVTPQGIVSTTLSEYRDALGSAFREALGADLDLAPETPQAQIIGTLAFSLVEIDEALVAVGNGMSLSAAAGTQLDDLGSLLGIERLGGTRSTVTATLTGASGTVIPEGTRVRTTAGDIFELTGDATIPSSGAVDAALRSLEEGPVPADAGTLTEIFDLVAGWDTVINSEAAQLGRNVETDEELRVRYAGITARNASASVESVLAAVLDVDGVVRAAIRENATGDEITDQGKTLAPHSICVVAEGGTDSDIATAIARSKPAGTATSGDTTVDVANPGGWSVSVKFTRVTNVPISITLAIALDHDFPSFGTGQIVRNILDWFDRIGVGELLDERRLLTPINSVPGHTITNITIARKDSNALADLSLSERFTIAAEDIEITAS